MLVKNRKKYQNDIEMAYVLHCNPSLVFFHGSGLANIPSLSKRGWITYCKYTEQGKIKCTAKLTYKGLKAIKRYAALIEKRKQKQS